MTPVTSLLLIFTLLNSLAIAYVWIKLNSALKKVELFAVEVGKSVVNNMHFEVVEVKKGE